MLLLVATVWDNRTRSDDCWRRRHLVRGLFLLYLLLLFASKVLTSERSCC